jgi:uncharacterized protein
MNTFEFQCVVTEKCNLGCKYCYMKNRASSMTEEVFSYHLLHLPAILERYRKKTYSLVLFGGEPLIEWERCKKFIELCSEDSRCTNSTIVSNGLLMDDEKLDWMNSQKIPVYWSWSFDGLWNDFNRPMKTGEGSLDNYLKKLDFFKKHKRSSKTMLSPRCVDTMLENHQFLVDVFDFDVVDFSLVRDNIWTSEDIEKYEVKIKDLSNLIFELWKSGKKQMNQIFGLYFANIIRAFKYGKRSFGCHAGKHGLGFMPDGKVYPCARAGSSGDFPVFDSLSGKWEYRNRSIFLSPRVSNPGEFTKCLKCEIYDYCNAGCVLSQLNEKNVCVPLDSICQLYKINYRESCNLFRKLKNFTGFIEFCKEKGYLL